MVHIISEYAEYGYGYDWAAANWFESSPVKVSVGKLCYHGSAATHTHVCIRHPN